MRPETGVPQFYIRSIISGLLRLPRLNRRAARRRRDYRGLENVLALILGAFLQRAAPAFMEGLFDVGLQVRWSVGELARNFRDVVGKLLVLVHPIADLPLDCFGRCQRAIGQHQFHRASETDDPCQRITRSAVIGDAIRHPRGKEPGILVANGNVAREHDTETAADRDPVDRGQYRLWHPNNPMQHLVPPHRDFAETGAQFFAVVEAVALEIDTGAEGVALPVSTTAPTSAAILTSAKAVKSADSA